MKHMRLYADEDGESRCEDVELAFTPFEYAPPAPAFGITEPTDAARYISVHFPAGFDSELHTSPRRQLFVVLQGRLEGGTSDGAKFILEAGDCVLMEDTSGKGHTAKALDGADAFALMVHLE